MNYTGEQLLVKGALFKDDKKTIPMPIDDEEITIFLVRMSNNETELTIHHNQLTIENNEFSYIIPGSDTENMAGVFKAQMNVLKNNSVIKIVSAGTIIIKEAK